MQRAARTELSTGKSISVWTRVEITDPSVERDVEDDLDYQRIIVETAERGSRQSGLGKSILHARVSLPASRRHYSILLGRCGLTHADRSNLRRSLSR
jgi:hypothetical protein